MTSDEVVLPVDMKAAKKLRDGYPLLHKELFDPSRHLLKEGTLLRLEDERGRFIARGYFGKQNKGLGWVLTQEEAEPINLAFFTGKLKAALARRSDLYRSTHTTAFRVFNGEGDGIGGLTIDYYDGFYVLTWYSEGIYSFRGPIIEALTNVASYQGIYQKKRFATDGKYVDDKDFVCGQEGEFPLYVKENEMLFAVYLDDGPMTGIFLDQRDVRKQIRDKYARDKRVLNTFSYTGAFSVAAALGGAKQTTSVDLANRSQPRTEEQFLINDIQVEDERIVVMDVFRYFAYARKKELRYDLVILDPPSFARSKKRTFTAAKDYTNLLRDAISVTAKHGVIVASTNASTFDRKKFKRFVAEAFKAEKCSYTIREEYGLPEDFKTSSSYPEGNYLKVLFIERT
uniref:class I SAM-dependent rRNA methyltransferase n=1 Tax=Shouchella shacheensis TaxID=1649580 RepID=UPI0007402CB9|nr:class I SAM-dependent rRNA methyltransferase [Shouchella shacheensis]